MKKLFAVAFVASLALVACTDPESHKTTPVETGDITKVCINEVNAIGPNDSDKFVEFYNAGDKAVSLEGVVIKKTDETGAVEEVWTGLAGESVPAKGFFVIQGTKNSLARSLSKGISAKKGVKLECFDADGNSFASVQHGTPADNFATAIQDGIWARIPDGGAWKNVTNHTPGAANDETGAKDDAELL